MVRTTTRRAPVKSATQKKPKEKAQNNEAPETKTTISISKSAVPARALTLITGGTGFLGLHLVHQLINSGQRNIRVLATSTPSWLSDLLSDRRGVEVVEGSIISPEVVARAVAGVTNIYHLAGRVSHAKNDAHALYDLHVKGTRILLEAALAAGTRSIVVASTSGTMAVTETGDVVPDESWPTPIDIIARWPYYSSKLYQETAAIEIFREKAAKGTRLIIMNPSLLLGPGDDRLSSTRVVLDFLGRKIFSVPSGGLSFVDVRDVAIAFQAAMEQGSHGERYLLGAANWTFSEFF
ncbi:MAG: NAD-dependent epimerase/dehydratase family protein, partial [Pyrinomonadaceae bacterium]